MLFLSIYSWLATVLHVRDRTQYIHGTCAVKQCMLNVSLADFCKQL